MNMQRLKIRFPLELEAKLEVEAEKLGVTKSVLARAAMELGLKAAIKKSGSEISSLGNKHKKS